MSDPPEVVQPPPAPEPSITRMMSVVRQLTRLRDEYTRSRDPGGRREAARVMVERADELRVAVAEVMWEAAAPAVDPRAGTGQTEAA